ncbi:aspartyl-tRNA(Asn)/glutamyl-tRNA(Gln) amidotransferase subunit B [Entomortierella parvispora]|uniref:Glutamyl-tRNA(Gln) amidotransferase subunit B, mitochondrial n=1 Tax=Entomortierella parvispora TaxID=205924 RepID=A0A9P3LT30_9FUNG|nr:aspartyl-tRNA(Asn)/glutamyl-tRNA(Gln) amidotransferase subunit B [Entomortierella parvispora]
MLQHKGAINLALARDGANIARRYFFQLPSRSLLRTLSTTVNHPASVPRNLVKGRWEPIIGLEIHAQIKSATKLFSEARTIFNAPTNTNVTLIDAAYPGTLPQLSQECVDLAIKTALALDAHIYPVSSFDRKHYFYPDLPQGYQITQHYEPLAQNGKVELSSLDGLDYSLTIGIEQLQLEQDTGKSLHDVYPGETLLDLNRAGTGLMEIVTKPDMRSSKEAGIMVKKLQQLLRAVDSSDGNMEEGSMRCDVNVSVHEIGKPFGQRCELKNLNSVKAVVDAIDAEIERQIQLNESNIPVDQETRGFDASTGQTYRIRSKETAPDYRYMPEPDLPRLVLSQHTIHALKESLPELPDIRRLRIMEEYDVGIIETRTLMGEEGMVEYFEQVLRDDSNRNVKSVVSWTIHELLGRLHSRNLQFGSQIVTFSQLGSLIDCVDKKIISAKVGKSVLDIMVDGDCRLAMDIVNEMGWRQIDDQMQMEQWCASIIDRYPKKVEAIKKGNIGVLGFFVGQIMKDSKGRANPVVVNQLLRQKIGISSK